MVGTNTIFDKRPVLAIALLVTFAFTNVCQADTSGEPIGKVLSVKQSGYATRVQQSVKHSIKAGDPVYSGDQIDVKTGNAVQIVLDANNENIIHIPGDSLVQISKNRTIDLQLSHGQTFALLDKLESGTKFRVVTPTAVSTVRGTYFSVKMSGSSTETSVYRGEVGVNGRQSDGKMLGAPTVIGAGEKTSVAHMGTKPLDPKRMTESEFNRINDVIGALNGIKKPLSYAEIGDKQASGGVSRGGGDADVNPSNKQTESDEEANAGGKVVF